jgi:tetratricopeptide (TPR) repeat protein
MFDSLRKKDNQKEIFRLIDEGFGALENGQLDQAAASAERILAIEANQVDALFLSGRVAQRRERLDLAQDFYERAILAKPDFIDPYLKMMEILLTGFQWEEAMAVCRLALSRVKPTLDQLVDICTALTNEFPEQIRELLRPALDRNNTNSRVWTAYQEVLHRTNVTGPEYDLFMAEMRDLFPGTLELDAAEALALSYQNRTEEAIALNQSLRGKYPQLTLFDYSLARIYRANGRYELADAQLSRLVETFPEKADFAFLLSEIKLCQGAIAEGLALNERRFARDRGFNWTYLPMPNWSGEPLQGKRILVIEEQGFGDCIMFGRYLPALLAQGARVRYVCRPAIYAMFAAQPALRHAEVLMHTASLQLPHDMDYYIANMSVANRLGVDTATAGDGATYLVPDPARVSAWREKLPRDGRPLVGITWAGNLTTSFGYEKSIPADLVPQILGNPDVAFVSLQMPPSLNDPYRHLLKHVPEIGDFNDTMAMIACLDAVISVDTSVAHLSAAMGQRTIMLSKFAPDWRWDGPVDGKPYWYPQVEVLRQEAPHDWSAPIARLPHLLRNLATR